MVDLKFTTAEDYIMDYNQEQVVTALQEGVVEIKFVKVNGEERTMLATLNEELIPVDLWPKDDPDVVVERSMPNPDVRKVYDVEKDGWRSFRWDSLISWEIA